MKKLKEMKDKGMISIDGSDNEDRKANPPIDLSFLMDSSKGPYPKRLVLEKRNDPLFVLKPVDRYEPSIEAQSLAFNPDPMQKIKRKFPRKPKSHAEISDCGRELTGAMLQKVINIDLNILINIIYNFFQKISFNNILDLCRPCQIRFRINLCKVSGK